MKDKKTLRREMKAVRAAVEGRAAADRAIGEALLALPEVAAAKSLFVYKSFGTEADTGAILAALCGAGLLRYTGRKCREVFGPAVDGLFFCKINTNFIDKYRQKLYNHTKITREAVSWTAGNTAAAVPLEDWAGAGLPHTPKATPGPVDGCGKN